MGMFMIITFLLLVSIAFYLTTRFHKLEFINGIKNKSLGWLISGSIILVGIVSSYIFGLGVAVYLIHLAIFFAIGDIFYKFLKKKIKYSTIAIIVLIITTGYITYARFNAHDIKKIDYIIDSSKVNNEINIIQITDTHLGTTIDGNDFAKYMKEISKLNPDMVLITGDFVDESTSYNDMVTSCKSLGEINTKYGVYIIFGNHDLNTYGGNRNYKTEEFIAELEKNNVIMLEDKAVLINDELYLIGRRDRTVVNRLSIDELTKDIDKSKLMIVMDHQPVDFKSNIESGIDLMLSGHTHGGQMFPLAYIGELVSENEMTYGLENHKNTTFITSSGMSGWGIPLKTGTVSEYVHIKIK